jgi:hypothetical protein
MVLPAALFLFFSFAFSIVVPQEADALPFFARQIGRSCTFCHTQIPKLNETGRVFRANGFRFEDEGEWKRVRDLTTIPVSFEVEVEGKYDRIKSSGLRTESSDMVIEEAEVYAGGAVGKTGRVSTLLAIRVAQTEDASGATTYEASAPAAFIQINDLSGPAGAGRLNLKAGQGEVALPFIGCSQKLVSNSHLAETSIGIFDCEQRLVELNGSIVTLDEESMAPTHRYSIGITRQDVNNDDKFLGYYASYSLTFKEVYSLGLIYRGGEERSGPVDINFNKYGGAAEAELGPFILTAGYFRSDRSGLGDLENYIIEAFVIPMKRIGLGARYDTLREKGKKGASSRSLMLRYSILNNMYGQFEFRALSDDDLVAGSNEEETKLRLFLTALF